MGGYLVYLAAVLAPFLFAMAAWRIIRAHQARAGGARAIGLVAGNVCVFLFLASLVFLGAESYYRFWYDQTEGYAVTLTSQRWAKRHTQVNNFGVRDNVDYATKRTDERRRIVFLGDSFTVGHGISDVEDRFVNLLRRSHGDRWEVHLFGDNGADTGVHLLRARKASSGGFEVDQYVLVYVPNDIVDIVPEWQEKEEQLAERVKHAGFLVHNSYAVNTFYFRCDIGHDPEMAAYFDIVGNAYSGPAWTVQQARLKWLAEVCRSRGAGFCVVLFPFLHDLDSPEYREVHQRLVEFWQAQGVPTLDLLPLFREHRHESLMVNRYDDHPNERAHELAAEAISTFLEEISSKQQKTSP